VEPDLERQRRRPRDVAGADDLGLVVLAPRPVAGPEPQLQTPPVVALPPRPQVVGQQPVEPVGHLLEQVEFHDATVRVPAGVRFRDRADAGRVLAEAVASLRLADPVVLALPRGGVPVAAAVATRLGVPVDVVVACKIGAPGHPELGAGAVAEDGLTIWNEGFVPDDAAAAGAHAEVARRIAAFRGDRRLPELAGRDVVVVDDGLATGITAEAATRWVQQHGPDRTVIAAPVGAPDTVARLAGIADEVVCPVQPPAFGAVGSWYDDFRQTGDDAVKMLLRRP
jgi:putative phosphoribosyl transferase